jgi:hypothetical protein
MEGYTPGGQWSQNVTAVTLMPRVILQIKRFGESGPYYTYSNTSYTNRSNAQIPTDKNWDFYAAWFF